MGQNRTVEPFRFFKIIIQLTLEDKKLGIPKKFVKKFGGELRAVATLRVPNGSVWKVGLTKEGQQISFTDGWQDFVIYHSICVGHFLVFEYAKNSAFDVLIFDMTACEIEYPYNCEEPENEGQKSVHKDDLESEDKALSSFKKKFQSHKYAMEPLVEMEGSRPGKLKRSEMYNSQGSLHSKRHTNTDNLYAPSLLTQSMDVNIDSTIFKTTAHNERDEHATLTEDELEFLASLEEMGIFTSGAQKFLSVEERQRVICAVKLFKPENPSFIAILRSTTRYMDYMYVPKKFANKYLNNVNKSIKLQDTDGKEWPAALTLSRWCGIKGGWPAFMKNNNLKRGDICLFELVPTEGVLLKVSVLSHSSLE